MTEDLLQEADLGEYRSNLIRVYPRWFLLVHEEQSLPGRCYIWWRVPGENQEFEDLPYADYLALQRVMQHWSRAVRKMFPVAKTNCEWLGNAWMVHQGHGHMHVYPRFRELFEFMGRRIYDENYTFGKHRRAVLPDGRLPQPLILAPGQIQRLILMFREHL